ncbi:MAG: AMP-binding protein, partial [Dongiaceae bacterium]
MNLYRLFERQARHQPAKSALADHQRSLSFGALDLAAGRHAAALMRRGVRPGDRVGVILKEHADHIALNLAILRLGAAFAVIDWRAPPAERQAIGDTLGIAAALLEPQMPPLEGIASLAIDEAFHRTAAALEPAPVHAAEPGDAAMIALSSGTTGFPKGAIITHDQAFHRFVAGTMA